MKVYTILTEETKVSQINNELNAIKKHYNVVKNKLTAAAKTKYKNLLGHLTDALSNDPSVVDEIIEMMRQSIGLVN